MNNLKIRKDVKANIVIQNQSGTFQLTDCIVYSNPNDEKDVIILMQDPNNPEQQVQVTLEKVVIS